jgi:phosphate transport system substrate-binding protein
MLKTSLLSTAMLVGFVATSGSALAVDPIYGGGGTLAAKVYRQTFDCYGVPVGTRTTTCTTAGPGATTQEFLYSPVGSGAGKSAFLANDPTLLGTPAASNTVSFTSTAFPAYPYPGLHFAGSDAQLTAAEFTTYTTNDLAKFGHAKQVPMFVTGIALPFTPPTTGFTYASNVTTPTGGSAPLRLSAKSVCGIFTGAITNWNAPQLTIDNNNVALVSTSTPIKVVVRADSSGTTAIFSAYLAANCTPASGFPYTGTPGTGGDVGGVANTNPVFAQLRAGNPSGYSEASGSGGIEAAVQAAPATIAYVSPDFVKQVTVTVGPTVRILAGGDPNGPVTANVQNAIGLASPTAGTGFEPVSIAATTAAISPTITPAATDDVATDWGQPAGSTNPSAATAYPIAGFTFVEAYTCYASASTAGDVKSFFSWYLTGSTELTNILAANGFSPLPSTYAANLKTLLTTGATTAISAAGSGSCTHGETGAL